MENTSWCLPRTQDFEEILAPTDFETHVVFRKNLGYQAILGKTAGPNEVYHTTLEKDHSRNDQSNEKDHSRDDQSNEKDHSHHDGEQNEHEIDQKDRGDEAREQRIAFDENPRMIPDSATATASSPSPMWTLEEVVNAKQVPLSDKAMVKNFPKGKLHGAPPRRRRS